MIEFSDELTIQPEDTNRLRALKDLLNYGNHKEGCDKSNEAGPKGDQHLCCSCGWCQVADWAHLQIMMGIED